MFTRMDSSINFSWGRSAPEVGMGIDTFYIVWDGTITATAGTYRITNNHDDGMRIYIDGNLVHNHWIDKGSYNEFLNVSLAAGVHALRIEFYENTGDATAIFSIQKL